MISGLHEFTKPEGFVEKGSLTLPSDFDSRKFVGKWVEKTEASINRARQFQRLPSEGVKADGWEVWKDNAKKPCLRPMGNKQYVLMFRSKPLQVAINKLCGNASRRRMMQEAEGEVIHGEDGTPINDTGMLTRKRLERIQGLNAERAETPFEKPLHFNDVTESSEELDEATPVSTQQSKKGK